MKMKVIGELGDDQNKALLIEIPQNSLGQLNVDADGCVSLSELIHILQKSHSDEPKSLSLEEHIELMDLIFNSSHAIDEKKLKRKD